MAGEFRNMKAISGIITDTAANLISMTKILPAGFWFLESDTMLMKVSDGVNCYASLPYKVDTVFTQALNTTLTRVVSGEGENAVTIKDMLDNAGNANGIAYLDSSGKLPMEAMPAGLASGVIRYVSDIAARNALTDKAGLIIVLDASGDTTVSSSSAGYTWHEDTSSWTKVFETESMDVSLSNYFVYTGNNANTLDDIQDGNTYVKVKDTWKNSIDSAIAGYETRIATLETAIQDEMVSFNDNLQLGPMNASEVEAALA